MKVASISTLKNQLSAHIDIVRSGETILITDRKQPVAMLSHLPPGSLTSDEHSAIAEGIIAPRAHKLDPESFLAMPLPGSGELTTAILEERSQGR